MEDKELLPIKLDFSGVDTTKMTSKEWSQVIDKFLTDYKYEVTLENMAHAKSDKTMLNKVKKDLEDSRKAYFKPYEQLKKQLIVEEKKIQAVSDSLRDNAKALEETIVDVEEPTIKEGEEFQLMYIFKGTLPLSKQMKFLEDLEKLAAKSNVEMINKNRELRRMK